MFSRSRSSRSLANEAVQGAAGSERTSPPHRQRGESAEGGEVKEAARGLRDEASSCESVRAKLDANVGSVKIQVRCRRIVEPLESDTTINPKDILWSIGA